MIEVPGIEWDFDHSMIYIAGVGSPAVVVLLHPCDFIDAEKACLGCKRLMGGASCLCPMNPRTDDTACDTGWSVYVPCENGALFNLEFGALAPAYGGGEGLTLVLHSQTQHHDPTASGTWLIGYHGLVGGEMTPPSIGFPGGMRWLRSDWHWPGCTPEWVAEHIQRVSTFPSATDPDAERVSFLPISDPRVRPSGHTTTIKSGA